MCGIVPRVTGRSALRTLVVAGRSARVSRELCEQGKGGGFCKNSGEWDLRSKTKDLRGVRGLKNQLDSRGLEDLSGIHVLQELRGVRDVGFWRNIKLSGFHSSKGRLKGIDRVRLKSV